MKKYNYELYHQTFKIKKINDRSIVLFDFNYNGQVNKVLLLFIVHEKIDGKRLNIGIFKNYRKSARFIKKYNIRQKQIVHIKVLGGIYKTVKSQSQIINSLLFSDKRTNGTNESNIETVF